MLAEVEILELAFPEGVAVRIRDRAYEVVDRVTHYDVLKLDMGEVVEQYRCYTGGGTEPKSCSCPHWRYRKQICKHMLACREVAKQW